MIRRWIIGFAAIMLSVPSVAVDHTIPLDKVARERFPTEKSELVDYLALVNRAVNGAMTYESDQEHYGVADHWVAMPADGKGDCEDYALSKQEILADAGFPIVQNARIRSVAVRIGADKYGAHAILELRLPGGTVMELDSLFDEPMKRADLERDYGYVFFDW